MATRAQASEILVELVGTLRLFKVAGHYQGGGRTISGTKVGVLRYLKHGDARLSDLAQRLSISPSVASRAVDALQADGLVARRRDDADARASLVSITPAGVEDLAARERHIAEKFAAVLADWESADVDRALQTLRQLNIHLDELAQALASELTKEQTL